MQVLIDCQERHDAKVDQFRKEVGDAGYGILCLLRQHLKGTMRVIIAESEIKSVARSIKVSSKKLQKVIEAAVKNDLLCEVLDEKHGEFVRFSKEILQHLSKMPRKSKYLSERLLYLSLSLYISPDTVTTHSTVIVPDTEYSFPSPDPRRESPNSDPKSSYLAACAKLGVKPR